MERDNLLLEARNRSLIAIRNANNQYDIFDVWHVLFDFDDEEKLKNLLTIQKKRDIITFTVSKYVEML